MIWWVRVPGDASWSCVQGLPEYHPHGSPPACSPFSSSSSGLSSSNPPQPDCQHLSRHLCGSKSCHSWVEWGETWVSPPPALGFSQWSVTGDDTSWPNSMGEKCQHIFFWSGKACLFTIQAEVLKALSWMLMSFSSVIRQPLACAFSIRQRRGTRQNYQFLVFLEEVSWVVTYWVF